MIYLKVAIPCCVHSEIAILLVIQNFDVNRRQANGDTVTSMGWQS